MATLVLGAGTSHTPMLSSGAEGWPLIAQRDLTRTNFLDPDGKPLTYEEVAQSTTLTLDDQLTPEVFAEKYEQAQRGLDELSRRLERADLDALIIVGDDQDEQLHSDNLPAILIYFGETIRNTAPKPEQVENFPPGYKQAWLSANYEPEHDRDYPVASDLSLHIIEHLIGQSFDIASSDRLPKERGEGHAFQFVHRRLMQSIIPIIPVMLNTYSPPAQPRASRCYEFGQAIARAVADYPQDARVGIMASGGLTHFIIDEEFDRAVLRAFETKDAAYLESIPEPRLQSGTSEIKNWIAVAGACESLDFDLIDYIPGYRSPAGTGTAMAFATWA
jgi:hypothetical protein